MVRPLLVCFFLLFAGALFAQQNPAADIPALLDKQADAWNRGDIAGYMETYWKSGRTVFVGSSGVTRGWENVLRRYQKTYPNQRAMGTLSFSDLEVQMLAPDAALALGHWQLKRENDEPGGYFTLVLRKFPQGWRIVHDHSSAVTKP